MSNPKEIWYNYWQTNVPIISDNYYDPNNYDWAIYLLENKAEITAELKSFFDDKKGELKAHFYGEELESDTSWQTHSFKTWGIDVFSNLEKCPYIGKFLTSHPMVISASINLLGANSKIKVHRGDTNAIFRCHLGLDIPGEVPDCGFSVGDEHRSWEEGELLIFNDASEHYAWNNTENDRIIFLFDVMLPPFISDRKSVCINVRAFLLLQYLSTKMRWVKKLPKFILRVIHFSIKVFLYIIYSYQMRKGVILKH